MSNHWENLGSLNVSIVKNLSLADQGQFLMDLSLQDMPGLLSLLKEYEPLQPLKGANVTGCLHVSPETANLGNVLVRLGAKVRWASSNPLTAQDNVCAALAKNSRNYHVFAMKGARLEDFMYYLYQALTWPNDETPHLLVDDGCIAYSMIHYGCQLEEQYEKTGKLYDPNDFDQTDRDLICMIKLLNHVVPKKPKHFRNIASTCYGSSEETTSGVTKYRNIMNKFGLLFPVFSTNDSVTKHKYDNIYGCKQSCIHGIVNGTEIFLIGGKLACVVGYGNVGKGVVQAFRGMGAKVVVTEADPICALQAAMEGLPVVLLEDVVEEADFFITTTGGIDCITLDHMKKMKDNAILGNIGQGDQEIDMAALENYPGIIVKPVKEATDKFIFPETGKGVIVLSRGRLYNLGNATGHPSFVMSASFANQVLCLLELFKHRHTKKYEKKIHKLPKVLDEKVARYHHEALGIKLTKLSQRQCDFLGIPSPEGPFKLDDYHY